jgi:hypothetical protein
VKEATPNAKIDKAMGKLLDACDASISPEQESGIKTKVEVLKAAMQWEKLKHGIRDKDSEGTEWGAPSDGQ